MEEQHQGEITDKNTYRNPRTGRILSGLILIAAGLVFMARQLGFFVPYWLFSWPVFLIALGLYIGAKHMFRNPGWIVLVTIGIAFLAEDIFPDFDVHRFILPFLLIVAGVIVAFKPYRGRYGRHRFNHNARTVGRDNFKDSFCNKPVEDSHEDVIDSTTILGGVKKNIISKNFKGGDIVCIMGGAEINLSQADIQGTVELEIMQIFGGAKLIIPANWQIKSEAMVILGSIEDKRPQIADTTAGANKVLVLKGTCIFGGIDIKSY